MEFRNNRNARKEDNTNEQLHIIRRSIYFVEKIQRYTIEYITENVRVHANCKKLDRPSTIRRYGRIGYRGFVGMARVKFKYIPTLAKCIILCVRTLVNSADL